RSLDVSPAATPLGRRAFHTRLPVRADPRHRMRPTDRARSRGCRCRYILAPIRRPLNRAKPAELRGRETAQLIRRYATDVDANSAGRKPESQKRFVPGKSHSTDPVRLEVGPGYEPSLASLQTGKRPLIEPVRKTRFPGVFDMVVEVDPSHRKSQSSIRVSRVFCLSTSMR